MFYKPEIRYAIREKRKQLSQEAIARAAKQVAAQLIHIPQLIDSKKIAYYIAQEGELDPAAFIHIEEYQNKHFFLPVVDPADNKKLTFYHHDLSTPLIENRFGIKEPKIDHQTPADILQLDIALIPLVSFDQHCNRIGRGAGYYDRTLSFVNANPSQKRPLLIGLAYEFQKIDEIIPSDWDIPMDMIVTEKTVYKR